MKECRELRPIFLLGAGRSGTKFLRDVLAVSEQIATVPYDVGYIWRYGNESVPHDALTRDMASENIIAYVRRTLPKLTNLSERPDARYILEKSVPNTLRADFLYKIYPDALFINLIRDGRAVTESSIRMWESPPERGYLLKKIRYFPWRNYKYAFWYVANLIKGKLSAERGQYIWGPRYPGMEGDAKTLPLHVVCARQWRACVEASLEQLARVPQHRVLEVRYEELMQGTDSIFRIAEFLGLSDKSAVVTEYTKVVRPENGAKWQESLRGAELESVMDEIGELEKRLGYVA